MNVNIKTFWNNIKPYTITIIITCILSIGGTIYFVQKGSNSKLRDMQSTITKLSDNNKWLKADQRDLGKSVDRLTEESRQRQSIIDNLKSSSRQIGQGLDDTGNLIQDTINRLSILESKISSSGTIQ